MFVLFFILIVGPVLANKFGAFDGLTSINSDPSSLLYLIQPNNWNNNDTNNAATGTAAAGGKGGGAAASASGGAGGGGGGGGGGASYIPSGISLKPRATFMYGMS